MFEKYIRVILLSISCKKPIYIASLMTKWLGSYLEANMKTNKL